MRTLRTLSLIVLTCVLFTPFANAELDESRSTQAVSAIVATVEGSDLVFSVHDHGRDRRPAPDLRHHHRRAGPRQRRWSTGLGPSLLHPRSRSRGHALLDPRLGRRRQPSSPTRSRPSPRTEIARPRLRHHRGRVSSSQRATIDLTGTRRSPVRAAAIPLWSCHPVAATTGASGSTPPPSRRPGTPLEIDMGIGGSDGAQAIWRSKRSGSSDRTAQINADGSAWFQDDNKPLPEFLPIAFGSDQR
jgi:hypothetical protein